MEICGIDEAGRGCIAGSLFMCGVVCEESALKNISNLTDSKKLTRKQREMIYANALERKIRHFIVSFSANEIDSLGLSKCLQNGLESIKNSLDSPHYIFDGNTNYGIKDIKTLIKGDSLVPQISLASIIAKVHKDRESDVLHAQYPQYNFYKHKGYCTKTHIKLIARYGYSPVHRKTFRIKSLHL